ncbi:mycofactocin-coupled SDR family oxidoreductase [Nocardioides sp.]|uniref:mycofactocin-coupled SDR family oxidoreductase n=1 Tax=Nocardioides sp. TaxID=35761 RepID=UPI0027163376|nr:mycofactocin-coupled SDR family oxidoreductase [Nocardioides sp.]MDO9458304.1 mycofactocin-coupled SDR family oxidoreductase [Nocardioides sp.]
MRVALVTGAARGIGAATVAALVADGCHVVALDSCEGPPLATRADLDSVAATYDGHDGHDGHDPRVVPVVADVRDRAALVAAVGETLERWGRLDAVVAAAAVIRGGAPLWETPEADLDELWEVTAKGVWNTAAATLPAMLAGPDPSGCRFVAVASAAGHAGLFHLAAYNATKHAVVGIVRGLAADLRGTGVTACSVSPGSTDTAMLDATADLYGAHRDDLVAHQALGRVLAPAEIAATVAFACSPAGAVLHGTDVHADGGFTG